MTRFLALFAASALTACATAAARDVSRTAALAPVTTKTASVDPDPCGLPPQLLRFGVRAQIDALPFAFSSLRVGVVPAPRAASIDPKFGDPEANDLTLRVLATSVVPIAERPSEIVLKSGYGDIEMGAVPATFECAGDKSAHAVPLHYTTLIPHAGESAEYVVGDAWLDEGSCKTTLVHRESILASPLAGGLIYAVREAPSVGAAPDRLTLFMPLALRLMTEGFDADPAVDKLGGVTRLSIPLRRGGGVSVIATFDIAVLDSWLSDGAEVNARAVHAAYGERELTIGLEITQSVGDPEPVGLVYIEKSTSRTFARTRLFECVEPDAEAATR